MFNRNIEKEALEFCNRVLPCGPIENQLSKFIGLSAKVCFVDFDVDHSDQPALYGSFMAKVLKTLHNPELLHESFEQPCKQLYELLDLRFNAANRRWQAPRSSFNLVNLLLVQLFPNNLAPVVFPSKKQKEKEIQCSNPEQEAIETLQEIQAILNITKNPSIYRKRKRTLRQN